MSFISSSTEFKFNRLIDNSDVWKVVDFLRGKGYIVSSTMNHNDIDMHVKPYPKPDDLECIKLVSLRREMKNKDVKK